MKENTNRAIFANSIILYSRLAITAICGFVTTRFALQALGFVDYGLFSVIGGIITFISLINTIMVSTSSRYISVSVGKNDLGETNKIFNICLQIHIVIAIITAIIAYPLGIWYINNYLNYSGDITNAIIIYIISATASIFTFITVPYHGLLTAKERFLVFCYPDVISHILRLILAYILMHHFKSKLLIYGAFMGITTIYPSFIYIKYCHKHFADVVKLKYVKDKFLAKDILSFSSWVSYGAVAYVGKNQGTALLVNAFFNTIMNTALGVANTINSAISLFSRSITQPIEPQISKSYASGNSMRCDELLVMSTKYTFLVVLLISSPFLIECKWILSLWLGKGQIPPYAELFTILIIVDTLIDSLNAGIKSLIFASGNIKLFQIIPSTIKLLSVLGAFFILRSGYPCYYLVYSYIFASALIVFVNQLILSKSLKYNTLALFKYSYFPSLVVSMLFIPILFIKIPFHPVINVLVGVTYLIILMFIFGLSSKERSYIIKMLHK